MRRPSLAASLAIAATFGAHPILAQGTTWRPSTTSVHPDCQMAYDAARDRFVAFSAGRTLEWDGATWVIRETATSPGSRAGCRMVYDEARGRTLLFGGNTSTSSTTTAPSDQLWEYDGRDWRLRVTTNGPSARYDHSLAYDPARRTVVMWGGRSDFVGATLQDTWEWTGAGWTPGPMGPSLSTGSAMGFHAPSGRMVLVGNQRSATDAATWGYDGLSWTDLAPLNPPPRCANHALLANPATGQLRLWGSEVLQVREWSGTDWILQATNAPPTRDRFGAATDGTGRTLILGGSIYPAVPVLGARYTPTGETLELFGTQWSTLAEGGPPPALYPTMKFDSLRNRLVALEGGIGTRRAWEWDGSTWTAQQTQFTPPNVAAPGFAVDQSRGVSVLFGGIDTTPFPIATNGTYEWDGTNWTPIQAAQSPPPISAPSLVSNPGGGVLLFNGDANRETWIYTQRNWVQAATGQGPSARAAFDMAADTTRNVVVLFGGIDSGLPFGDTWEWNGLAWSQRPSPRTPSPRYNHSMTYDPVRQRTILVGGFQPGPPGTATPLTDEWEWDGGQWIQVGNNVPQQLVSKHSLTFDTNRGAMVLTRSQPSGARVASQDLWIGASNVATATEGGAGCGATTPTLHGRGAPALGDSRYTVDMIGGPASALSLLAVGSATGATPLAGCTLYTQNVLGTVAGATNANGFEAFPLPIPADPVLLGFPATVQGLSLDPAGALSLSSYVELRLGL